ncbi:cell wall-binding repeat-containing protein [Herbiconiux sp. YIM B11900]|uniref:cell wall-binding repeat-containing protein n=1 Tax=Herbiconiux sp. YIM B11900 TaxID=3404131 RepID=UPI003F85BF9E
MTLPMTTAKRRRRAALVASVALGAVALSTALAAPLSASAATSVAGRLTFCPTQITKVGTAVAYDIADPGRTAALNVSVIDGELPDGLALIPHAGLGTTVEGTPTKTGTFTFTLNFSEGGALFGSQSCVMDIVPTTSIVDRVDGANRYDVSANVANRTFPSGKAPLVYVASGGNYADALSASAIAAEHKAPLILSSRDGLHSFSAYVHNVLASYEPSNVVVVGGESTLHQSVIDELKELSSHPTVTRIGGADRFEVSRNLISNPTFGALPSSKLFIASGLTFPDALSASPAAAKTTAPLLLVNGNAPALSSVETSLITARGVTGATLFGGLDSVSASMETSIKAVTGTLTRVDGADRYAVSANTSAAFFTTVTDTIYFATGANFPDALAGGVLAGVNGAPILLTQKSCVAQEVADQVRALKPKHIVLLGGPNSLDANLENLPICA